MIKTTKQRGEENTKVSASRTPSNVLKTPLVFKALGKSQNCVTFMYIAQYFHSRYRSLTVYISLKVGFRRKIRRYGCLEISIGYSALLKNLIFNWAASKYSALFKRLTGEICG